MFTGRGVHARIGQTQPFDRLPFHQVLLDDFVYVFRSDEAVPDRIRIDHHGGPVLALVQASSFVDADLPFQARVLGSGLKGRQQGAFAIEGAAPARRAGFS